MKLTQIALVLMSLLALTGGSALKSFAQSEEKRSPRLTRLHSNHASGSAQIVVVDAGPLVHTAQILPWDKRGRIVGKGDAALQIEQVWKNVSEVLAAAAAGEGDIVKLNVYVAQAEFTASVQAVFAAKFKPGQEPAVSFVVGNLTDPDALVAMDAVALTSAKDDGRKVKRLRVPALAGLTGAAAAILPAGSRYYVSGQAKNGSLSEAVRGTLTNLNTTLTWMRLGKSNVVQLKAYLQPISAAAAVEAEVTRFFGPELAPPIVFVAWSSPTNTPIEIELIAADDKPPVRDGDSVNFLTPPALLLSKVFSRVAHVNHGRIIYFSAFYGKAGNDAAGQLDDIFTTLKNLLPPLGSDLEHLVKATYYVVDSDASTKLNEIRPKFFNPERPPAASKAVVRGVGFANRTVAVDMIAVTR